MSESAADANGESGGDARADRGEEWDALAGTLDEALAEAARKIESGRVRDVEKERVRIKRLNALARVADVRRKVLKDATLADLESRMEEVEAREENRSSSGWPEELDEYIKY